MNSETWSPFNGLIIRASKDDGGTFSVEVWQRSPGDCDVYSYAALVPPSKFIGNLADFGLVPADLSSKPPERTRAPAGCDDCSVEPGELHRFEGCPGARRQHAVEDAVRFLTELLQRD